MARKKGETKILAGGQALLWEDVRYFLEAARIGSFLKAGQKLGVMHTTVARRVSALEARLKTKLLTRSRAGLALTPAGEDVMDCATRAEYVFLEMERRVLGQDAALRGSLRVAAVDALAVALGPALAAFSQKHPDVTLDIVTDIAAHDLTQREADVALRITSESPPDHLVGRRLGVVSYAAYAARTFDNNTETPTRWIIWGTPQTQARTTKWLQTWGHGAHMSASAGSALIVASMVRAGMGAAWLPCLLADADPALKQIWPPSPALDMDLWALTHPDLKHTARIKTFIAHIAAEILLLQPALRGGSLTSTQNR